MLKLICGPLLALGLLTPAAAVDESELLPVDQAFVLSHQASADGRITLRWQIAEGYYLYRHRFDVQAESGYRLDSVDWPPGTPHEDEFFGKTETYRGSVTATLNGAPQAEIARIALRYQGCADLGICYPPQKRSIEVALPIPAAPAAAAGINLGLPPAAPTGSLLPGLGAPAAGLVDSAPLPPEQAFGVEAIAVSGGELLLRFTPAPGYYLYRDKTRLALRETEDIALGVPGWPEASPHRDEHFGEVMVYFEQIEVPLPLRRARGEAMPLQLDVEIQGCQTDGICYPPMQRALQVALPAAEPGSLVGAERLGDASALGGNAAAEVPNAALALLFALLGGLILNLMPCVLPVLSFKLIGLAESQESRAAARRHAIWYTAGVLLSFAAVGLGVLALREGGQALGWGFQLQQPLVVAALVYVMLAVGLSLSGLFQIGAGLSGAGQSLAGRGGRSGDFFTGVLAVVVATPCTAPFMGGAVGFTLTNTAWQTVAVFVAIGVGMALPYLLLGWLPRLLAWLPRPGPWLGVFRQLLGFPMLATAAWLAWVLSLQAGADGLLRLLVAAVLLAFAAWAYGWLQRATGRRPGPAIAGALASLLALGGTAWQLARIEVTADAPVSLAMADGSSRGANTATQPAAAGRPPESAAAAMEVSWEPWSAERVAQALAQGRPVLVDFTAAWCITCQANKRLVLDREVVRAAFVAQQVVLLRADWTRQDPAISAELARFGRNGVPFYLFYASAQQPPRILPELLTVDTVLGALDSLR
jgi:thiol:disulfide interchange protein DsbD